MRPIAKREGINGKDGGIIRLYDGYVLQKEQKYTDRKRRVEILRQWKKDIKRLEPLTNYYFTITPNL